MLARHVLSQLVKRAECLAALSAGTSVSQEELESLASAVVFEGELVSVVRVERAEIERLERTALRREESLAGREGVIEGLSEL